MKPLEFKAWVERRGFSLSAEKPLQAEISAELSKSGVPHEREVRLTAEDVVDFMLPAGLAVEVKLAGQKRAVYRQCERYCRSPDVRALVLVTASFMRLPAEIAGKPCYVASLGRGWLG